jgi:hypothetical protein
LCRLYYNALTCKGQFQQYFIYILSIIIIGGRYRSDNQNPYIEEEQTTQWPKEKVQKDKQRSIKHTYETKDRVTRIH